MVVARGEESARERLNRSILSVKTATSQPVGSAIATGMGEMRCVAFSPDGRSLAAVGMSGTIRFWDLVTRRELLSLEGHSAQVNGLAFAPDGSALASCDNSGVVRIWRAERRPGAGLPVGSRREDRASAVRGPARGLRACRARRRASRETPPGRTAPAGG